MKKNLFAFALAMFGMSAIAQSPRLSLYEEFTGETCPPCAAANPALNALLASPTNTPKVVAIKWQVPIPSAPANAWSLYKTNKTEIDWRYKAAPAGYGYAISSAPSGKMDGRDVTVFGAGSNHPNSLNSTVISTAQSYTSAFTINMSRAWNKDCSAITVTVDITATAPFTSVGNLVFRTVMVENLITFSVQSGTNGEKKFEDVAIRSYPSIQAGTPLAGSWTLGQTKTFTLNCVIPTYTRKKEEIAFVGFIQDDGNRQVAQAFRLGTAAMPADQLADLNSSVDLTCTNMITPKITITNNGTTPVTAISIMPVIDNTTGSAITWTGNIAIGTTTTIAFSPITTPTAAGAHTFSYTVTDLNNAAIFNVTNNQSKVSYLVATNYQATPVAEGFLGGTFPPASWTNINKNAGPGWSRSIQAGGYAMIPLNSIKYDFYNNTVTGDQDELYLPPMDLTGGAAPTLEFDLSYALRSATNVHNDILEVYASDDCGANWTNVYSMSGMALATTADEAPFDFIPANDKPEQWRTETVDLTGFNKSEVLVKFVTTNDNGSSLFLDNINLYQKNPVGISKAEISKVNVTMFPNPATHITTVKIDSKTADNLTVNVVNTLGQVVYSNNVSAAAGTTTLDIDVKGFANGIYNVNIESGSVHTTKKLTVVK